jgi:hypothetical protein
MGANSDYTNPKGKTVHQEIKITKKELLYILNLPFDQVFPAIRTLSARRGLLAPNTTMGIQTRFDSEGNYYQRNFLLDQNTNKGTTL